MGNCPVCAPRYETLSPRLLSQKHAGDAFVVNATGQDRTCLIEEAKFNDAANASGSDSRSENQKRGVWVITPPIR